MRWMPLPLLAGIARLRARYPANRAAGHRPGPMRGAITLKKPLP